jgi:hypothetical protein
MGLAGGPSGPERVGPSGSARSSRIGFFSNLFFNAKTIPVNTRKGFYSTKNSRKITKIPGKFLEID